MKNRLAVDADELEFSPTAHVTGLKKIFFDGTDVSSDLTQFAYGRLESRENIPEHRHPTMEEFFYFLSGTGTYMINGQTVALKAGVAVKIPPGALHILTAHETLGFLYFGIAT